MANVVKKLADYVTNGLKNAGKNYNSGVDAAQMSDEDYTSSKRYGNQYDAYKKAGNEAGMQAAHDAAQALRAKYDYSGGEDGSQYNKLSRGTDPAGFTYESAPSYVNKYQGQIDAITKNILNREAFSYDPEKDPIYKQYRESYTRNGQKAMEDTLGQISARTGGLASSYAASASQQTYDNYMGELADKIPELKQLAYSMYQDEGNNQRANLEMLQALEQGDYAKYADLLGQYNNDRNYGYQAGRDQVSDSRYDQEWDYSVGRDQVSDSRYDQEWNYQTAMNRWQRTGVASGADAAVLGVPAGTPYSMAQAAGAGGRSSGTSGKSTSTSPSSGEGDYDSLFADAQAAYSPQNFIASNYKKYGFHNSSGLSGAYEKWATGGGADQSLSYNTDEGLFDWNGERYTEKELDQALTSAVLTAEQKKKILETLDHYGFDFSFH